MHLATKVVGGGLVLYNTVLYSTCSSDRTAKDTGGGISKYQNKYEVSKFSGRFNSGATAAHQSVKVNEWIHDADKLFGTPQ